MSKHNVKHVLLITKPYQTENIKKHWKHITAKYYSEVETTFLPVSNCLADDLNICSDVIARKDITCVISINDQSSLVHAALVEKHKNEMCGPSLESVFIIQNKYYTRSIIGSKHCVNIPYSIFTLTHQNPLAHLELQQATEFIAKPISGSTSKGLKFFQNKSALMKFCKDQTLEDDIVDTIHPEMTKLVKLYMQDVVMKYSLENGYMIEEYINHGPDGARFHALECLVLEQGVIIPWSICDNIYWRHRPECFMGNIIPSTLPSETQIKAWNIMKLLAGELMKFGFKNHFLQGEVIVFSNGDIKLLEINSHMTGWKIPMHTHLYSDGDPFKASVDLASGKPIQPPTLKSTEIIGIHAILSVFGNGLGKDFIDVKLAKQYEEIELLVDEETEITDEELSGFVLAYICSYAKSVNECLEDVKRIGRHVLKKPESSPWFEQ